MGAAQLEVEQVCAASELWPPRPLATMDVDHAFGTVRWPDALETILRNAKSFAPALAAQRAPGVALLYSQQRGGSWKEVRVHGGLFFSRAVAMGTVVVVCALLRNVTGPSKMARSRRAAVSSAHMVLRGRQFCPVATSIGCGLWRGVAERPRDFQREDEVVAVQDPHTGPLQEV